MGCPPLAGDLGVEKTQLCKQINPTTRLGPRLARLQVTRFIDDEVVVNMKRVVEKIEMPL